MILDTIVARVRERLAVEKQRISLSGLQQTLVPDPGRSFQDALRQPGTQIIAELKKASPSAGIIAPDFDPTRIAREYESAGAAAISVLTEPDFFQGSLHYLDDVRNSVSLPLLRKDFIIDPYQLYQARAHRADCILLIAAILPPTLMGDLMQLADELHLDVLAEVHNEAELEQTLKLNAPIIGVNNRNLKTFQVDISTSLRLKAMIPADKLTVSESGIKTQTDVRALEQAGFDAMLIGESLMRAPDKRTMIRSLQNG